MVADSIEIFHGPLSPVEAHLYVQVSDLPGEPPYGLRGTLRGPISKRGRTLASTAELIMMPAGPTLLGRFVVGDPTFWSAAMPALYRLRVDVTSGDDVICQLTCETGFRTLGVAGHDFLWEGRRWVLRGAHVETASDVTPWLTSELTVVLSNPDPEFCRLAAEQGLRLVAWLDTDGDERLRQLRWLQRTPAVLGAVLSAPVEDAESLRSAGRNLLLGQPWHSHGSPAAGQLAEWVDMLFWQTADDDSAASQAVALPHPVIACKPVASGLSAAELRQECDRLQRDLAHVGDFAGYLAVLPPGLASS